MNTEYAISTMDAQVVVEELRALIAADIVTDENGRKAHLENVINALVEADRIVIEG